MKNRNTEDDVHRAAHNGDASTTDIPEGAYANSSGNGVSSGGFM